MTGISIGARQRYPSAGRARIKTLIGGRQTRTDIVVATTLLVVAFTATVLTAIFAAHALLQASSCTVSECSPSPSFDILAASFLVSILVGSAFGLHAILNLLNRRNAWGYALLDALVSVASLLIGLTVAAAV